jgi:hypothetical protein
MDEAFVAEMSNEIDAYQQRQDAKRKIDDSKLPWRKR